MSSLTAEQVRELTERVGERLNEFPEMFERPVPGVVRIVYDVIEEWQCANPLPMVELSAPGVADTDMMDGYHIGWERGREALRAELAVAAEQRVPLSEAWATLKEQAIATLKEVTAMAAPKPTPTDPEQIRADIRDYTAYPDLEPEPNGDDVFAGVHPVAGGPGPVTDADRAWAIETAQSLGVLSEPTNGNGHHAELSTATVATLGPEHTVVTPIVPRREKPPVVDDDTLDRISRPGARAKKELDEIRDRAAAKARLSEVTREQMIAELKRQAMAGVMPTQDQFDIAKPAVWPKAQMIIKRFDAGWTDLAREAGLKLVRR